MMFMETIYTPGVAHLSYILGDGGRAAVIDPRRDVEVYLQIAQREGAKINRWGDRGELTLERLFDVSRLVFVPAMAILVVLILAAVHFFIDPTP